MVLDDPKTIFARRNLNHKLDILGRWHVTGGLFHGRRSLQHCSTALPPCNDPTIPGLFTFSLFFLFSSFQPLVYPTPPPFFYLKFLLILDCETYFYFSPRRPCFVLSDRRNFLLLLDVRGKEKRTKRKTIFRPPPSSSMDGLIRDNTPLEAFYYYYLYFIYTYQRSLQTTYSFSI